MSQRDILSVAVHADDETLGCGGSLLKLKDQGHKIHWLILTCPSGFTDDENLISQKNQYIDEVATFYGFNTVTKLNLPDTGLDTVGLGEIIGAISKVITEIKPDTIFLPFHDDVHSDYRIAFDATYACTKSFRYPYIKRIYMTEIISETEFAPPTSHPFQPTVFINITDFLDKKIEAMNIYGSEMGKHPFPRSEENIRALATFRGATVGCHYAESFMLLRETIS